MYVCIYIYIYTHTHIWRTPHRVGNFESKVSHLTKFYCFFLIKTPKTDSHLLGGSKFVFSFLVFFSFVFLCHFFFLPLLLYISNLHCTHSLRCAARAHTHTYIHTCIHTYIYIYTYIYIHIYAVELKTGPRFGVSSVKNWSKSSVKNWSKFFTVFPIFIVFGGYFWNTNSVTLCQNSVFFVQNFGDVKSEVFEKKITFFVFVFFMLEK